MSGAAKVPRKDRDFLAWSRKVRLHLGPRSEAVSREDLAKLYAESRTVREAVVSIQNRLKLIEINEFIATERLALYRNGRRP